MLEEIDVTGPPELPLQRPRRRQNGPRAVCEGLATADPVEDEAKAPFAHAVAEEQEMATAQLCGERDRNRTADIPGREIGDDVELLPRVEQRLLQCQVVVRRHEQLMRPTARPQQRRQ